VEKKEKPAMFVQKERGKQGVGGGQGRGAAPANCVHRNPMNKGSSTCWRSEREGKSLHRLGEEVRFRKKDERAPRATGEERSAGKSASRKKKKKRDIVVRKTMIGPRSSEKKRKGVLLFHPSLDRR